MFAFQSIMSKLRTCKNKKLNWSICKTETQPKNIIRIGEAACHTGIKKYLYSSRRYSFISRWENYTFVFSFIRSPMSSRKHNFMYCLNKNIIRVGDSACQIGINIISLSFEMLFLSSFSVRKFYFFLLISSTNIEVKTEC